MVLGAVVAGSVFASGCVTEPADARTIFVSPEVFQSYEAMDCQQVHQEFEIVRSRLSALSTGPMLFRSRAPLTPGMDRRTEMGITNGRYDALRQVSARKRCGLSGEAELLANLPTYVPPSSSSGPSQDPPPQER